MIYMFLLKKKPFSYRSIELYKSNEQIYNSGIYNTTPIDNCNIRELNNHSFYAKNNNNNFQTLSNINLKTNYALEKKLTFYKSDLYASSSTFSTKVTMKNNLMGQSFKDFKVLFNSDRNKNNRLQNFQNTDI